MRKSPTRFTLAVSLALILALTARGPGWVAAAAAEISDVGQVIIVGNGESGAEESAEETEGTAASTDGNDSGGADSAASPDTDLSRFITKANHGLFLIAGGELITLNGATFAWGVKRDAALVLHVTGAVNADYLYTYALPHGLTGKTDGWQTGKMLRYELKGGILSVLFDNEIADFLPLDVNIPMSLKLDPDELVSSATWAKLSVAVSDGFRMAEISISAPAPSTDGFEEDEPMPTLNPEPMIDPEPEPIPEPTPDPVEPTESGSGQGESETDQGLQNQTEVFFEDDDPNSAIPPEGEDDRIDDPAPPEDEEPAADPDGDDHNAVSEEFAEPSDEPADVPENPEETEEELEDTAEETETVPERSVDVERIIAPILADGETFELVAHLTGFDGTEPSFLWQYSADGVTWTDVEDSNTPFLTVVAQGGNTLYGWRVLVSAPTSAEAAPADAEGAPVADEQPEDAPIEPAAPDA